MRDRVLAAIEQMKREVSSASPGTEFIAKEVDGLWSFNIAGNKLFFADTPPMKTEHVTSFLMGITFGITVGDPVLATKS